LLRFPAAALRIDRAVMTTFRFLMDANRLLKQRQSEQIAEVVASFTARSIDVMLLKGAALDLVVYERPWYTISSDVDLVIRRRKDEVSAKELQDLWALIRRYGNFECDFFHHHDVTMNGVLAIDFQGIWDDAVTVRSEGLNLFLMSPENMLIAACINCCRRRFFRLKALCDIQEVIAKFPAIDWDKVCSKAKEYRCQGILYTAFQTAAMTLGCKVPSRVIAKLSVGSIRKAAIRHLSCPMGFCSEPSIFSGVKIFDKTVGRAAFLPYVASDFARPWKMVRTLVQEVRRPVLQSHAPPQPDQMFDDIVQL
jgi:hypothetical protein